MSKFKHIPVLKGEVITGLNIKPDGIYVDATLGGGGHAREILSRLNQDGHLYAFDQDQYAIEKASSRLNEISNNFTIINDNFVNIKEQLNSLGVKKVDGVLYDLGVSSFQLDIVERGFSYHDEAVLDMRMNKEQSLTAYDVVNKYSFDDLVEIFFKYGEERYSRNIARNIIKYREEKLIQTTTELAEIVISSVPPKVRRAKAHPARQIFQAIRIAVNDELNVFEKSLLQSLEILKSKGRIAVITFHSLEDRIAKHIFRDKTTANIPSNIPIRDSEIKIDYRLINRRVIVPSDEEIARNNRARSAKLRIIEKK